MHRQIGGLFIFSLLILSSCRTPKHFAYYRDIPDSTNSTYPVVPVAPYTDPIIKSNDILQVSILTLDPLSNDVLSRANTTTYNNPSQAGTGSSEVQGFMVDSKGFLELPIVGKIKAAGLTTSQAKDSIYQKVAVYNKNPVVNVRFLNFSITVLGEVNRPGTYVVPNEKASVMDAIGLAGDLTIYGKRQNVMLVRDSAGFKQFTRFDLTSSNTLKSPYYYLRQGDVIYIEPNRSKIVSSDGTRTRTYALMASVITVIVLLISRIK